MSTGSPATAEDADVRAPRGRDAETTRRLLLEAARLRFARDGYSATTVRDIASDVGVNVALINRYFTSKEGLFERCLERAVTTLDAEAQTRPTFDTMLDSLLTHIGERPQGTHHLELLLLLRSSGDDAVDRIRTRTLTTYAERLAVIGGWQPGDASTDHIRLRAQVAIATAMGIVILRSTTGLEPLGSAGPGELAPPVGDVLRTLLT